MTTDSLEVIVTKNVEIKNILGDQNENIKIIERDLDISISQKNHSLELVGQQKAIEIGARALEELMVMDLDKLKLGKWEVAKTLDKIFREDRQLVVRLLDYSLGKTAKGKLIRPKTLGQRRYVQAMEENFIVFGIGPAGSGKTYLAIARAAQALKSKEVDRIILTRPAVEAGEKLGFLPGDLQEKVDPYLRPVYDALYDVLGLETCEKYLERGAIEIAPLAYMRGRTLDNAYIILDEAQNSSNEQMKMILTRIGKNSKLIVTGDITQTDLSNKDSGLKHIGKILGNIRGIDFAYLGKEDIVRHPIVQKIIEAYERYEDKNE